MAEIILDLIVDPTFWTIFIVCFLLVPAIAGMIFGSPAGRTVEEVWVFRGAGVEIAFILVPFVFYAVGHSLNGGYDRFMASPELPMAAMILFAMTLFSILKGLSAASKRDVAVEPFMVLTLLAVVLSLSCGAYISWLAFKQDASLWCGVFNSGLIVFAVFFSFGVHSAMTHMTRYPNQLGSVNSPEEEGRVSNNVE